MKLPTPDIATSTSSMISEQYFGVGDTGLIFDILRNKLYKDPITAIAREICSNARDAHREVGNENLPIEVIMPNSFSPYYKVRDFGPGISPERMENIFIKYANSTKRNSNLQTGCFGIGSKSPFSYTDSFSIITVVDGVKYTYNAYIDETQQGKMALASKISTDEKNGTTVCIPVKPSDFKYFVTATVNATNYWTVRPTISGISTVDLFKDYKPLVKGTDWDLSDGIRRPTIAIIDGIAYELSLEHLKCTYETRDLLGSSFHLFFKVGELSLSASRDSIHYDEKTVSLLTERIKSLISNLSNEIQAKVNEAATYRQATEILISICSKIYSSRNEIYKWNGKKVYGDGRILNHIDPSARCTHYFLDGKISRSRSYDVYLTDNSMVFLNDFEKDRLPPQLIKSIFEQYKKCKNIYLIRSEKPNAELISALEIKNLSTVSIVKQPRKAIVNRRTAKDGMILVGYPKTDGSSIRMGAKVDAAINQEIPTAYVEFDSKPWLDKGHLLTSWDFSRILEWLKIPTYTVPKGKISKLGKNWMSLKDAVLDKLNKTLIDYSIKQMVLDEEASPFLPSLGRGPIDVKSTALLNTKGLLGSYLSESKKILDRLEKFKDERDIVRRIGEYNKYSTKDGTSHTMKSMQDNVKKMYPLLDYIQYCSNSGALLQYITLVDESESKKLLNKGVV